MKRLFINIPFNLTPTKTTMSKASAEIIDMIKMLAKDMAELKISVKELQEDNASSAVGAEKMYKTLNAKLDMFKNLEAQTRETIQQTTTTGRKPTRPAFFKSLFLENRDKYLDILYTQEEIDAAFLDDNVVAKKKESDRISKVVTILYTNGIKGNNPEGRKSTFDSLYDKN